MKRLSILTVTLAFAATLFAQEQPRIQTPDWAKNRTIYEVNVRQFSPEGTFKAVEKQLPVLKDLGVGILWLMPINPIGEKNRKGTLGSYYSVRNYTGINPEFGTEAHFRDLVKAAHAQDMKVIIDWVANHTAWDHPWVATNPEYFSRNEKGELIPPVADWADVIDLNYDVPGLHADMIDAMKYWVETFDLDGFRCDVAGMVPVGFWNEARRELDAVKPVFMLAEAHEPELHVEAFDMTYGWQQKDYFNKIASGEWTASKLRTYYETEETKKYHPANLRMIFITNHDENTWNGNEYKRLGAAYDVMTVLTFTLPGMPLIYNGQEAGMTQELQFFDRDPIAWQDHPNRAMFQKLTGLRREHPALWSGAQSGSLTWLDAGKPDAILAFDRKLGDSQVRIIANLSASDQKWKLKAGDKWVDFSTGKSVDGSSGTLKPWSWLILIKQ